MSCRQDRNCNGGNIMVFVYEVIPSKLLTKYNFPSDIKGLFIELKLKLLLLDKK